LFTSQNNFYPVFLKSFSLKVETYHYLEGAITMCGIFGFALRRHIPMVKVFRVLQKLEAHKYPNEPKPVGGFGAGVAILKNDGSILLEKVGKDSDVFPAKRLSEIVKIDEASVLIAHVRMPSPQFMETAKFRETAQPYVAKCYSNLTVVLVHNGYVANYKEIEAKLDKRHVFESKKVGLIDSEIIPHLFEELLLEKTDTTEALDALFNFLKGRNAIGLLQIEKEHAFIHLIHKKWSRGLTVWTNSKKEVVFCSRREPLMEIFGNMLKIGKFEEKVFIPYHKNANLRLSFPLAF
jgi:glucosamine 6-phosphate synthetase-like amidotransferase/phosphosugar isomerase protein